MAKIVGPIKHVGVLGGIINQKDGTARIKPASYKIKAERTLELNAEFSRATNGAKLIYDKLKLHLSKVRDKYAFTRLVSEMKIIVARDTVNIRGKRTILKEELVSLKGFDFNVDMSLSSLLFAKVTTAFDRVSGDLAIHIDAHSSKGAIKKPKGATHYQLYGVGLAVDFQGMGIEMNDCQSEKMRVGSTEKIAVVLPIAMSTASIHPIIAGLGIRFYQLVNGEFQLLEDKMKKSFAFVEVFVE